MEQNELKKLKDFNTYLLMCYKAQLKSSSDTIHIPEIDKKDVIRLHNTIYDLIQVYENLELLKNTSIDEIINTIKYYNSQP